MSEWWRISTPKMTFAVKIHDDMVVAGAPIIQRFVGQPAKNLGAWVRQQGDVEFVRLGELPYVYSWGNNEKRVHLKGRPCRIVSRGAMRSVMIEFADGQREIVSIRALRKGEQ